MPAELTVALWLWGLGTTWFENQEKGFGCFNSAGLSRTAASLGLLRTLYNWYHHHCSFLSKSLDPGFPPYLAEGALWTGGPCARCSHYNTSRRDSMTQESISSTSTSITPLARRLSSKSLTPDQLHSIRGQSSSSWRHFFLHMESKTLPPRPALSALSWSDQKSEAAGCLRLADTLSTGRHQLAMVGTGVVHHPGTGLPWSTTLAKSRPDATPNHPSLCSV